MGSPRDIVISFPDKDRTLRFDTNALSDLEEYAHGGVQEMLRKGMNIAAIRLMVRFGLQWRERGITNQVAGQLIQAYVDNGGALDDLFGMLIDGLRKSGLFAQIEEVDEAGAENPPKAADAP